MDLPLFSATDACAAEDLKGEDERSRTAVIPFAPEKMLTSIGGQESVPERANPTSPIRILIVDDSAINRYMKGCNLSRCSNYSSFLFAMSSGR